MMFNQSTKKLLFSELITIYDNPALTGVIYFWNDYERSTVLLAYAEYTRRGQVLNSKLIKKLDKFLIANNTNDVNSLLDSFLKTEGFNTYEEYYKKGVSLLTKVDSYNDKNESKPFTDKVSMLRILLPLIFIVFLTSTNPSLEDHRQKVIDVAKENMDKAIKQTPGDPVLIKAGESFVKSFMKDAVDNIITRENFFIFSFTHSKILGQEKNIGIGILGKVYLFKNEIELPQKNTNTLNNNIPYTPSTNYSDNNQSSSSNSSSSNQTTNKDQAKECDDMTSFRMGYSSAEQQVGNGIMTDCDQMWDNIHHENDGLTHYCFCQGWGKYLKEHNR